MIRFPFIRPRSDQVPGTERRNNPFAKREGYRWYDQVKAPQVSYENEIAELTRCFREQVTVMMKRSMLELKAAALMKKCL